MTTTEAFETWANEHGYNTAKRDDESYKSKATDDAYNGYQAATERAAKLCEDLEDGHDLVKNERAAIACEQCAAAIRAREDGVAG